MRLSKEKQWYPDPRFTSHNDQEPVLFLSIGFRRIVLSSHAGQASF
jgi:hypothetical protein